jgi:hypothetical protein
MITSLRRAALSFALLTIAWPAQLRGKGADYHPELFQSLKLVYSDTFDGSLNTEFWEVRQNTAWEIKDGILTGSPSSKEFQDQKKASNDPSHAGLKPVIWLKKVPENFVCSMRMRYDAPSYQKKFFALRFGPSHPHAVLQREGDNLDLQEEGRNARGGAAVVCAQSMA